MCCIKINAYDQLHRGTAMIDDWERYRKHGEEAIRHAERAIDLIDKAEWLRLAGEWIKLAESTRREIFTLM